MEIKEYFDQKKEFYQLFQEYIDCEGDSNDKYANLLAFFQKQKIGEDSNELVQLLRLLISFSNNHHRGPLFFSKIEKIIQHFEIQIKQTLSKSQLFQLFKKNKILLLFLIENKIMDVDKDIFKKMIHETMKKDKKFCHFFYPEIKSFIEEEIGEEEEEFEKKKKEEKFEKKAGIKKEEEFEEEEEEFEEEEEEFEEEEEEFNDEKEIIKNIKKELLKENSDIFTNFDSNRHQGENGSYICSLIRQDSVAEFVKYINQANIDLSSEIKYSVFETNRFLIKKMPTLIQYAAFFGSIRIFNYLLLNKAKLNPSLWLYTIHSCNNELFVLLEENHLELTDDLYEQMFKESIKCHHNDLSVYLQEKINDKNEDNKDEFYDLLPFNNSDEMNYDKNFVEYAFHYCNYEFLKDDFNQNNLLLYACKYNYLNLVKILLRMESVYVNFFYEISKKKKRF